MTIQAEKMDVDVNKELRDLWDRDWVHFKKQYGTQEQREQAYAPMQYPPFKQNALVFVGINPSFSNSGWERILKKENKKRENANYPLGFSVEAALTWPTNGQPFKSDQAIGLEELARRHYPYFKPHQRLADQLTGGHWDHIDLFACRNKKQNDIEELFFESKDDGKLNELGIRHFEVFGKLLRKVRPRALIVASALASRAYHSNRKPKPAYKAETGHYLDSWANNYDREKGEKGEFPVFYSGMLTGGRALDVGSRDRLFWQVAHALDMRYTPEFTEFAEPVGDER